MFTGYASLIHFWLIGALQGAPKQPSSEQNKLFLAPNCPEIIFLAPEKDRWPIRIRFGAKCKITRQVGGHQVKYTLDTTIYGVLGLFRFQKGLYLLIEWPFESPHKGLNRPKMGIEICRHIKKQAKAKISLLHSQEQGDHLVIFGQQNCMILALTHQFILQASIAAITGIRCITCGQWSYSFLLLLKLAETVK